MNTFWRVMTGALAILLAVPLAADEVSVTVYNSNLGVVREIRSLTFEKGTGRIAFTDVAAQIDPPR